METVAVVNPKTPPIPKTFYYIDLESVESGILVKENIVSSDDAPSRAQRVLQINDILYQTVRPYQKNNYFFEVEREIPTVASTGYAQIRTAENPYFFYELFHTPRFVSNVLLRCTGTSYPAVSGSDLNDIKVAYPNRIEQQKIAAFVQLLEKRIDAQRRLVEALKSYKRGALSRLFPKKGASVPEYRFAGFSGDWEERKLNELCSLFTDGDWIESKDQSESGIRLIQTGNVGVTEYLDKPSNKKWVSHETFERLHCTEVKSGDILISRLPEPAGRACIMPNIGQKMITAVDCTIARIDTKYCPEYVVQYLSTQTYFDKVNNCLAGGTRQRISRGNLSDFLIPLPTSKNEQEQIGEFFRHLDDLIILYQQEVSINEKIKNGLLQGLFI